MSDNTSGDSGADATTTDSTLKRAATMASQSPPSTTQPTAAATSENGSAARAATKYTVTNGTSASAARAADSSDTDEANFFDPSQVKAVIDGFVNSPIGTFGGGLPKCAFMLAPATTSVGTSSSIQKIVQAAGDSSEQGTPIGNYPTTHSPAMSNQPTHTSAAPAAAADFLRFFARPFLFAIAFSLNSSVLPSNSVSVSFFFNSAG